MGSTRKKAAAKPSLPAPALSPVADPNRPAAFFTFYSFKGGVGRTMALVNTAAILAGRGFRVLMIDLDLEAPGLSYLNAEGSEAQDQPGFIDLIADVLAKGEAAPFAHEDPHGAIRPYIRSIPVPEAMRQFDDGALYVMPAGRLSEDYEVRLQGLDMAQLYAHGRGRPLVQLLKQRLLDSRLFDYVLVDSRTGFSDEAGISVRDLGDRLIVIMGLNRQNALGTARFLQRLKASGISPKSLDIVLSPVPMGEDELYMERKEEVSGLLHEALGETPELDLELPYHPRLALSEDPHVFGRRHDALFGAYQRLEERVRSRNGDSDGGLLHAIEKAVEQGNHNTALRDIRRLARVNREFAAQEAVYAARRLRGGDAAGLYLAVGVEISPHDAGLLRQYAFFLTRVGADPARVEEIYRQAVDLDPTNADALGSYAIFLDNLRNDPDRAEEYYRGAIDAAPGDAVNLANCALFLGKNHRDPRRAKEFRQRAEELFRRDIEGNPEESNMLGNYAKLLLALGRQQDGVACLRKALELRPEAPALQAELHFYAYAHQVPPPPEVPLRELKRLLLGGVRSEHWPLQANVDRAIQDGHREPEFLKALAAVVSAWADIKTLEAFAAWRQA